MKKISKRMLSIVLAIMLLATTLPFSATTAFAAATDDHITALKEQIVAFQTAMDGNIYEDMKTGYDAYVAAFKLYDAAYYGSNSVSDSDVVSATTALSNWLNSKTLYVAPSIAESTRTITYGSQVPLEYSDGFVYATTPAVFGGTENSGYKFKWIMPKDVVFVKGLGNTMRVPICLGANNNGGFGGNDRAALGFMMTNNASSSKTDNAYFKFNQPWKGYYQISKDGGPTSASDFNWGKSWAGETASSNVPGYDAETVAATNDTNRGEKQATNNKKNWNLLDNYIYCYNENFNFTNNLATIPYGMTGRSMRWTTVWSTSTEDYHYYTNSGTFYVIDYSQVQSAISSVSNYVKFGYKSKTDTANHYYLNGELDAMLTALNSLQVDCNPTTGWTSSNYASRASTIANNIKNALAALNTAQTNFDESDKAKNYLTLKEKMYMTDSNNANKPDAKTAFKNGNSPTMYWTAATWTPFSSAYTTAQGVFDAVVANGYTATSLTTNETAVNDTYLGLKALANFTPIDNAILAIQTATGQQLDSNHRFAKSTLEALVAKLGNASSYPYLNNYTTAAQRYTIDSDYDAAIQAEADALTALIASDLDVNSQVDMSAFQGSIDDAKDVVNNYDPDAYTGLDTAKQYLDNYSVTLENVTIPGTCVVPVATPEACAKTQAEVDADIANYLSNVHIRQYTVTLDGVTQGSYDYGTTQTFASPTGSAVDWEYSYQSATSGDKVKSSLIAKKDSLTITINGNTTLTTKTPKGDDAGKIMITYKSSLGKVYDIEYVTPNSTVDPTANEHPNYAGYTFRGYDTEAFTATEDTVVRANYEATSAETFDIFFVNSNGLGEWKNPANSQKVSVPFNTRFQFKSEYFTEYDYIKYWEDEEEGLAYQGFVYDMGGDFEPDDVTEVQAPTQETFLDSAAEEGMTDVWSDNLYAISIVEPENYSTWRTTGTGTNKHGRQMAVKTVYGLKEYDTTEAPNTERLIAVGDGLDHVWRAQEGCYIVFYTREQFEDAIKADVFEGISTDADPDQVAAVYAYSKTTRVIDSTNGEKNHIDFRGTTAVVPDGATFVETGFIFSYKKNATEAEKTAVQNAVLDSQHVDSSTVYRVKVSDEKLTRRSLNTGYQFALQFITKLSKYPAGTTLDIKYRTYTNYMVNGQLKTIYSDEITPDTFTL